MWLHTRNPFIRNQYSNFSKLKKLSTQIFKVKKLFGAKLSKTTKNALEMREKFRKIWRFSCKQETAKKPSTQKPKKPSTHFGAKFLIKKNLCIKPFGKSLLNVLSFFF